MAGKLIIFGDLNKKYLLPFLLAIAQIANKLIVRINPGKKSCLILEVYATSFGFMIAIFIPCIFKLNGFERGNDKKLGKKKKLLFYLILMAIFCIYSFVKGIPTQMKMESITDDIRLSDPLSEGPFIHISIDMILFTITTILFLKYRYYRHNFISMLFFVILGSCCDIILNYYSPMIQYGFTINFLDFLSLVTDIICFCFQKYLMEFLYFPYWNICFANGLALFILSN